MLLVVFLDFTFDSEVECLSIFLDLFSISAIWCFFYSPKIVFFQMNYIIIVIILLRRGFHLCSPLMSPLQVWTHRREAFFTSNGLKTISDFLCWSIGPFWLHKFIHQTSDSLFRRILIEMVLNAFSLFIQYQQTCINIVIIFSGQRCWSLYMENDTGENITELLYCILCFSGILGTNAHSLPNSLTLC